MQEVFTVEDVAKMLIISESEVRKLIRKKQITYFEIGEENSKKKNKRFWKKDVLSFIEKNTIKADDVYEY